MSYGIYLYDIETDGIDITNFTRVDETGLSYNWGNYCDVWSIRDYDGDSSAVIEASLRIALDTLEDQGIIMGVPDFANSNWSWGTCTDSSGDIVRMPDLERRGVFMYHLNNLLELAERHPDAYWITDSNDDRTIHHDILGDVNLPANDNNDSDDDDDDLDDDGAGVAYADVADNQYPYTYFQHPIRGNIRISTFDDCMEVYGIMRMRNDDRAPYWRDLAFRMQGAPRLA